jgi:hypothetical protein
MEVHKPDAASADPAALSIHGNVELSNFAKRVTCRLASRYVERDAIFKLRYQAYLRAGLVSENSFGRHIEPADHAANAYLMGLYGTAGSSVLCAFRSAAQQLPIFRHSNFFHTF